MKDSLLFSLRAETNQTVEVERDGIGHRDTICEALTCGGGSPAAAQGQGRTLIQVKAGRAAGQ